MAPESQDGCRLFVYGVAEGTPNLELQAEFERFGLVTDTYNTGKGYAFVTFENRDDARTATEELNGATVCGQQIKVDVAKGRWGQWPGLWRRRRPRWGRQRRSRLWRWRLRREEGRT